MYLRIKQVKILLKMGHTKMLIFDIFEPWLLYYAHDRRLSLKCENVFGFPRCVKIYCMIYFGNFPKKNFEFYSKLYIKNLTLKILFFFCLFLFHWISFNILEKMTNIGGHRANYLSRGPNSTPSPTNFEDNTI